MRLKKGNAEGEILSILGEGAEMTGEISFTSGLRINGIVKGKIKSDAILEIGPSGQVDAEVNIRKIVINGEFRGVVKASDRVEIHKEGKVFGDIYSPCLIIEAGALFEGRCNMSEAVTAAGQDSERLIQAADPVAGKTAPSSPESLNK
jgi:cytoskeletal protein CcmA (bactofilin family)